jgi:hypothetical protein
MWVGLEGGEMRSRSHVTLVALLALLGSVAACSNQAGSAGESGVTQQPGTPLATLQPTPTAVPTAPPATPTGAAPSPVVYTEIEKTAEGGHGMPPPIDLPAEVVVDYSVTGSCTFTVALAPADGSPAKSSKTVDVMGGTTTDSWKVHLTPGSYVVQLGEAVGCTFKVTVRAPS